MEKSLYFIRLSNVNKIFINTFWHSIKYTWIIKTNQAGDFICFMILYEKLKCNFGKVKYSYDFVDL